MNIFKHIYKLPISDTQKKSLAKLRSYNVNVAAFIRDAIREKIDRDWHEINKMYKYKNLPEWKKI